MFRQIVNSACLRCSPKRFFGTTRVVFADSNTPPLVLTEVNEKTGYAKVSLNRAPVNGLNLELLTEIANTIDSLESSKAKGLILTSSFPNKVFSAGLDLKEVLDPNPDRLRNVWMALQDVWVKLYGCTFPSVAIVNGHAPAGGCLLALCCEYRLMYPMFKIGLNEIDVGLVVPPWLQVTMRNVIGAREAELACTKSKMFSSEDAVEIGLVDEIVEDEEQAVIRAISFLDEFKYFPSQIRSETKLMLRRRDIDEFREHREQDTNRFIHNVLNPEFQERLEMYLESLKNSKNAA